MTVKTIFKKPWVYLVFTKKYSRGGGNGGVYQRKKNILRGYPEDSKREMTKIGEYSQN